MPSKQEKQRMLEYLEDRLKTGGHDVKVEKRDFFKGIESHYLLLDYENTQQNSLVFCVDTVYTQRRFDRLLAHLIKDCPRTSIVFFKDGTTFFRNAAEHHDFKRKYDLSLKRYSAEETHRMISMRPEEIIQMLRRSDRRVQYYQPSSERLQEGIETYQFGDVYFDYSHISSREQFKPANTSSERIFIWNKQHHWTEPLTVQKGLLLPASQATLTSAQGTHTNEKL